jgi:hypothetical protein
MSGDVLFSFESSDLRLRRVSIHVRRFGCIDVRCHFSVRVIVVPQAVLVFDDNGVFVIQPNADGSYWRKIVRNKIARMKEKRREKAAIDFAQANLPVRNEDEAKARVVSTWGPYKSTSGVAKSTVTEGVRKVSQKELKVYAS